MLRLVTYMVKGMWLMMGEYSYSEVIDTVKCKETKVKGNVVIGLISMNMMILVRTGVGSCERYLVRKERG